MPGPAYATPRVNCKCARATLDAIDTSWTGCTFGAHACVHALGPCISVVALTNTRVRHAWVHTCSPPVGQLRGECERCVDWLCNLRAPYETVRRLSVEPIYLLQQLKRFTFNKPSIRKTARFGGFLKNAGLLAKIIQDAQPV